MTDMDKPVTAFETRLHARVPEVKWSFVEPDTTD